MACAADPARTVCDLRDRQHVLMGYRSGVALLLLAASATASATERIVTLAPHLAELVCAVHACRDLVGVAQYTDTPPEAARAPHVGNALAVNLEERNSGG